MSDDPTPRTIAKEVLLFALLFVIVGVAFVGCRVMREGTRVLHFDPRQAR